MDWQKYLKLGAHQHEIIVVITHGILQSATANNFSFIKSISSKIDHLNKCCSMRFGNPKEQIGQNEIRKGSSDVTHKNQRKNELYKYLQSNLRLIVHPSYDNVNTIWGYEFLIPLHLTSSSTDSSFTVHSQWPSTAYSDDKPMDITWHGPMRHHPTPVDAAPMCRRRVYDPMYPKSYQQ